MGQKPHLKDHLFLKQLTRWAIALAVAGALGTGVTALLSLNIISQRPTKPLPVSTRATPTIKGVTALGRLEPDGEVIRLSASNASMQGARVAQLMVSQGDLVGANQVIAVLEPTFRYFGKIGMLPH